MKCLFCETENMTGVVSCAACGRTLPVYGAPDGFTFVNCTGKYYRDSTTAEDNAGGVQRILWFDPVSGGYETQERAVPMKAAAPVPQPVQYASPEGFALDKAFRLYFRDDGANNAIALTGGKVYTIVGDKTLTVTKSKIYLDGKEASFTAYSNTPD